MALSRLAVAFGMVAASIWPTDKCNMWATETTVRLIYYFHMNLRKWLISAAHPSTARRASFTSLIVGTVLVAINHGPAIVAGQLTRERILQILLTFIVPYVVSTVSSVSTRYEMQSALTSPTRHDETLAYDATAVGSDAMAL